MHKISQAFTSTLDYQEVVGVVAQRIGNLIGAQFASVLLADDDGRHLNIVASNNLSAEYVWTINQKRKIPIGLGPIGMAYAECRPFSVKKYPGGRKVMPLETHRQHPGVFVAGRTSRWWPRVMASV